MVKNGMKVLFVLTTVALFLMSCATPSLGVYDTTIPEDQQCTLNLSQMVEVIRFNGNEVSWNKIEPGVLKTYLEVSIKIPSGHNTLVVNFQDSDLQLSNVSLSYDFLPGKTYAVMKSFTNDLKIIEHL